MPSKKIICNTALSVLIGFFIVLPFIVLEWNNTGQFTQKEFPMAIFGFMWLNAGLFIFVLLSLIQQLRSGVSRTHIVIPILKGMLLVILALGFINLVVDQLPCFLGVPNCD